MKKALTLLLAMTLVLSMGVVAFAGGGEKTTEVSYTTATTYVVTVPAAQEFTSSTVSTSGKVEAKDVLIEDGKQLKVSVQSANDGKLTYECSEIAYTATCNSATVNDTQAHVVLTVAAGITSGEATLNFATDSNKIAAATKAGKHVDTLTFTCEVVTATT